VEKERKEIMPMKKLPPFKDPGLDKVFSDKTNLYRTNVKTGEKELVGYYTLDKKGKKIIHYTGPDPIVSMVEYEIGPDGKRKKPGRRLV